MHITEDTLHPRGKGRGLIVISDSSAPAAMILRPKLAGVQACCWGDCHHVAGEVHAAGEACQLCVGGDHACAGEAVACIAASCCALTPASTEAD